MLKYTVGCFMLFFGFQSALVAKSDPHFLFVTKDVSGFVMVEKDKRVDINPSSGVSCGISFSLPEAEYASIHDLDIALLVKAPEATISNAFIRDQYFLKWNQELFEGPFDPGFKVAYAYRNTPNSVVTRIEAYYVDPTHLQLKHVIMGGFATSLFTLKLSDDREKVTELKVEHYAMGTKAVELRCVGSAPVPQR